MKPVAVDFDLLDNGKRVRVGIAGVELHFDLKGTVS
jgi:hypothetical protein